MRETGRLVADLPTRRFIAGVLSFFLGQVLTALGLAIISRVWAVIDLRSLVDPNLHRGISAVARGRTRIGIGVRVRVLGI